MKKLLILSNILLLSIIIMTHSCTPGSKIKEETENGETKVEPFHGISLKQFALGVARYKTTHTELVKNDPFFKGQNFEDARSCWFSTSSLKQFIALIENSSAQLKINPDSLGIRFYYAAYPSKPSLEENFDPINSSRHTLYLVPTFSAGAGIGNIDFDPLVSKKPLGESIIKNFGIPSRTNEKMLFIHTAFTAMVANAPIANQGQLCPANCPKDNATLTSIDQSFSSVNR